MSDRSTSPGMSAIAPAGVGPADIEAEQRAQILQAAGAAVRLAREAGARLADTDALLLAQALASVIEGAERLERVVTRAAADWARRT